MTFFISVLAILVGLALMGFALAPLMAATGLWAASSSQDNATRAAEIQRMLDEPDR